MVPLPGSNSIASSYTAGRSVRIRVSPASSKLFATYISGAGWRGVVRRDEPVRRTQMQSALGARPGGRFRPVRRLCVAVTLLAFIAAATAARHSRVKSSTTTRMRNAGRRGSLRRCALAATAAANRQALLAIEPVQLLVVHAHALALEQDAEPPVAEAAHARRRACADAAAPLRRHAAQAGVPSWGRPRAACRRDAGRGRAPP
jgi:hypothetical protein